MHLLILIFQVKICTVRLSVSFLISLLFLILFVFLPLKCLCILLEILSAFALYLLYTIEESSYLKSATSNSNELLEILGHSGQEQDDEMFQASATVSLGIPIKAIRQIRSIRRSIDFGSMPHVSILKTPFFDFFF